MIELWIVDADERAGEPFEEGKLCERRLRRRIFNDLDAAQTEDVERIAVVWTKKIIGYL
jgi:hypothetical protein